MDRFIRVNGRDFSFEEVAKALGLEVASHLDPVQVHLCQRVDDGILVAKGAFFDKDDYPGIDLELELPAEKDSLPVMISRCEQPRADGEARGLRNFCYSRADEYFMYFDVDTRADDVVDKEGVEATLVLSGSRSADVDVYEENSFIKYKGPLLDNIMSENPNLSNVEKIMAGMVGHIKDEPGIKKSLRGKAFRITDVSEVTPALALCTIEGQRGVFSVYVSQMEDLSMPEVSFENTLAGAIERSEVETGEHDNVKEHDISLV